MSDHDPTADRLDNAYIESEALLNDNAARLARRARVMAAVARQPSTPRLIKSAARQRRMWRLGGWLSAASLAGLCAVWATRVYPPDRQQELPAATPETPKTDKAHPNSVLPILAAKTAATSAQPTHRAPAVPSPDGSSYRLTLLLPPPRAFPEGSRSERVPAASFVALPPPAPPALLPRPAAPPPIGIVSPLMPIPPTAHPAPIAPPQAVPPAVRAASAEPDSISRLEASTDSPSDAAGAKLRAAAADGKIDEIQALLDQGVPVDAPDIDGNTALMVSIKADRAAAAALLYQNGANLDLKNRAGLCARDMAKAENNININQAIGLVHRK